MDKRFSKFLGTLLVICMVISMIPAAVFAASTPDVLYLKPNSNWLDANARFAAYFYIDGGEAWVDCTDSDGDGVYEAAVPAGFTSVIFCRMNPDFSTNSWDYKWNQTSDLNIPTDGSNCYTIEEGAWDNGNGTWSTFSPVVTEYYLVGFINGANYGCEEDYENMGEYKFVDGKLVVTFTQDSYVFLKSAGNANWYMAESYCTDTTCTLYESGTEKMFVPGNAEVTFTLTVNGDGTLTLSYTAVSNECSHSYTSEVTTAATCTTDGVKTFTCANCGDSYTESIAATGHSYSGGSCTVCGELDPDYVVTDTGFVLVTDSAAITDGGKFVLVAMVDGSYKALGTTLSSGKIVGVDVSVSNRIVTGDSLPIWTIEAVDGGVALSVDGSYLNYSSSTNFKLATDAYAWSVTAGDSGFIFNSTATTRGIYYSVSAAKFGAYSTSYVSSSSYVSNLMVFKYQVGTQGCAHSYTSEVTQEATCAVAGVMTYTCDLCGDSYTESIATIDHSYSAGTCTVCGAADSGYNPDYYLFGFINGANYGCEEDYENLGEYKFSNGKLVTSFTSDSYVGIKTGDNSNWYMTQSYVSDSSATFYNTSTGATEKMFVPGNADITFTLVVNSDGTLTLSYTAVAHECSHSYSSEVTTAASCTTEGVKTYTCSKCGDSYTEAIAATGHSYSGGTCTVCGELDPDYVVTDTGFVLVTDSSAITAGGKFVIAALVDGSYKALGTTLSSGKIVGVDVSVSNRIVTGDSLPIWTIEAVDGGVALSVDGSYLNYSSSTNFKLATDAYAWSVTAGDSGFIFNSTATTRGIYYSVSAAKFGAYSTSYVSSSSYVSNLVVFKYQVGTQGCAHNYTSEVTQEATCAVAGVMTYTCGLCGDSYTESIATIDHSYSAGTCTVCGAADSGYNPDYYLFGFINGANYGCEEDYENLGEYKFSNGKLVTSFTSDSYVGIKTGDNSNWYMTQSYVSDSSATFYNTSTGATEKMFVPGNADITFTLVVNSDGTLTLSYTAVAHECSHSYSSEVTTAASCTTEGVKTYTCSKCGDSYTEAIAATGHSYSGGTCTVCGELDPDYVVTDTGFVLVTDSSAITAGGKFVIVALVDGSYKALGTTLSSGKIVGVDVSVSNRIVTGDSLPIWTIEAVDGGVALSVDGSYLNYSSSTNFKLATDAYAWSVTAGDSGFIFNSTATTRGIYYSVSAAKFGAYSTSYVSSSSYVSNLVVFKYQVGTQGCAHSYTSEVTQEATCAVAGVMTYTCDLCGDSYTESIATIDHSYSNGICTVCGAADPDYVPDYYLFGYINGADYGIGDDQANLGEYKFVDGMLTVKFTEESYVAVKTSDNASFYMTNGYIGAVTSATLYKFTDPYSVSANKLLVPGNQTVHFTLTENWDGNLTLSYTVDASDCVHTSHSTEGICTACGTTVEHTYSLGVCTICGAQDPYYAPYEYYLFGYINGANYGCEEDASNLGEYKFVDGTLIATFTADSYIGIKEVNPGAKFGAEVVGWYMTQNYVSDSSATFYNTSTGAAEKMFVPGNAEVTFTLTVNDDGTLSLSYVAVANECSHSYSSEVTTAATCTTAGEMTYTCANCGDSYTEAIAATGHSYSGGTCTVCGELDPDYVVTDTGFVLVTDSSAITAGGKFVIVALVDGSYKALGTTLSSGKIVGVDVSVSNRIVTGDSLPIWTIEAVDGGIALSVDGSYLNYSSSTNFKLATDAYAWSVTAGDSGFIFNSTATTRGIYYSVSAAKFGAYATSNATSSSYVSNLMVFKYQVGTQGCAHSYTSEVTQEATCAVAGVMTYTCNLCGDSYTETIATIDHSYSNGTCTVCGAADPDYVPDYYLFGYINGANYGCEEDYENLGQYKFTDGKLVTSFTADSYVGIKTGDNNSWYMTQSYVSDASATFYNTATGAAEKMFVPGNAEITFTLVVNDDGTLTLSYTAVAYECSHSYSSEVTTAATCTTDGVMTYTCSKCGDSYTESIAATGHSYASKVTAPTCTTGGYTTYTCSACGDSYTGDTTAATGHSYDSGKVTTAATCTIAGVKTYTCTTCGTTKTESIAAIGHSYTSKVTAPTCTANGYTTYTCSNCGDSYTGNTTAATGHSYTSKVTTAATCTTAGVRTYTCSKCGNSYTESIAATGHSYTSKVTVPTCTTGGYTTYTCSGCGNSYTGNATAATGHSYVNGVCQNCGDGCDHSYTSKVTTAATCTTAGVRTYTCSICGSSYTESITPTGHSYTSKVTAATCTTSGYTTYTCSTCGYSYTGNTTSATGHSYTSKVTTAATCTTAGVRTYTCSICGDSYTEAITPIGHSYTSKVTAATCTTGGYTTYTCSTCGYSYTGNTTAATGHSYSDGYCTSCGAADPDYVGPSVDYYLIGYINGADYGCEGDYANLGEYKFVNGQLVATFDSDSYVFIKTGDNSNWYMFQSYVSGNSGTLYNTSTGTSEKMYVPGNVEVTFTLVENADGSLNLSYTTNSSVTVPTITLSYPTLAFEDEILYNAYFTIDDASSIVEMGMITFSSKLTNGTIADAVDVISGYTTSGSNYIVHSNGIPAKNLGDALYFKVYAKLSDGTYAYSDVAGYNAVAYAKTILNSSSSSAAAKSLVVAMLNYGAAAQTYFGYNTGSLMNANLTAAQKALVSEYSESMVTSVVSCTKSGNFVNNGGYSTIYPTVSFEGAFSINYYFATNYTPDSAPTFYYWDAATYNSVSTLTTANATGTISMTLDGDQWFGTVSGIAAKEIDQTYYTAGIYTSGGTTYTSPVISYSLGKYCQTVAANGEAFGAATAVYGYYAKAYFAG